jgi:hypothetical protein
MAIILLRRSPQHGSRMHHRKPIADIVDIGSNAHDDSRNPECFGNLESGVSVRIKKVTEDQIGSKTADARQQGAGCHPSVERP